MAGDGARGSDLFVTLEPCAHYGNTPPCSRFIIDAGVSRVFAAVADPNPESGDGFGELAQAGIDVQVGMSAFEAAPIYQGFLQVDRDPPPLRNGKVGHVAGWKDCHQIGRLQVYLRRAITERRAHDAQGDRRDSGRRRDGTGGRSTADLPALLCWSRIPTAACGARQLGPNSRKRQKC